MRRSPASEGWTQERITRAKGVDKGTVSRRIKFHFLPEAIKRHVGTGDATEGHLKEITEGVGTFQLLPWLESASSVKREVLMGTLAEGHLQTISGLVLKSELFPWLTTEQAWAELAARRYLLQTMGLHFADADIQELGLENR